MNDLMLLISASIVLESFPISSSGHLTLIEWYMQRWGYNNAASLHDIANHIANFSPALILPIFFYDQWVVLWHALCAGNYELLIHVVVSGFVAELITVGFYAFFSYVGTSFFPLSLGFFISGIVLGSLYWCPEQRTGACFTLKNFLVLGIAQGFALLPGVSRLGTTFAAARWLGLNNQQAFFISSLIQWPISVAGFFKGFFMLNGVCRAQLLNPLSLLIMLISVIIAYKGLGLMRIIMEYKYMSFFSWYLFFIAFVTYIFIV